jgi:hypothetical protein
MPQRRHRFPVGRALLATLLAFRHAAGAGRWTSVLALA